MEGLLTTVKTQSKAGNGRGDDYLVPQRTERNHGDSQIFSLNGPEDALGILKSKPELQELNKVLHWLQSSKNQREGFNIKAPSPKAAQIVHALVNYIIPEYWPTLRRAKILDQAKEWRLLVTCLSSVTGIGAIISRLRFLLGPLKESQGKDALPGISSTQPVETLLEALEAILCNEDFITSVWNDVNFPISQSSRKSLQWKESVSLFASGKVLSIASEASISLNNLDAGIKVGSWVGDGYQYAAWLGRNIRHMIGTLPEDDFEYVKALSQLLKKALSLGYTDQIIEASCSDLLSGDDRTLKKFKTLVRNLLPHDQRVLLYSIIRSLSKRHLCKAGSTGIDEDSRSISRGGVAALIVALNENVYNPQEILVDWLVGTSAEAVSHNHESHCAVIAALSPHVDQTRRALQKSLELFGDKLLIKHAPILHQEVNCQISLMLAGYAYRENSKSVRILTRSSVYLNAISNRLAASSQRARFLGMILGTAMSELVDPIDKKMAFSAEELSSSDGLWYRSLTRVDDTIGSISDLQPAEVSSNKALDTGPRPNTSKAKATDPTKPRNATSQIISIEEVGDSSESGAEDLPMYEKPDSDPLDEDEDPTLVARDRPTAPVYIHDLIAGLRDTENFDRHKLALTAASSLIRRKASFGTEVSDNIEELASLLTGLSDKWELENFQQMRLQGMIAVLTAEPLRMGRWFSMTFYNGDYSMGQRLSVLTTIGLGARELAGLAKQDATLTGASVAAENAFPSSRLPEKLHNLYALETSPVNALTHQLERKIIQPMAAEAADKISGPNALKVRTFSSRMAVEKKRQKPIPNALAKIVAEEFFFPLTGRWRIHIQAYGDNSSHTDPFLLTHLIKTLSLILHASGPFTLSLPQMTSEFWDLLLSLRPRASDSSILEALLFAFLTLLDINENDQRQLAEAHAKELLETQEWVESIFERIGGGSEEGDRIRMLAAGVLVRTREVVERYQRTLMGNLVDFM